MVYGDIANGPTSKFLMSSKAKLIAALAAASISSTTGWAAVNVMLTEVPDYSWQYGCFGTASGNLMGYWDRHGLPNLYTGVEKTDRHHSQTLRNMTITFLKV